MTFEVLCDNKTSYQIALGNGRLGRGEQYGKVAVLIRCDRTDAKDDARGLALANKIKDYLNTIPEAELVTLLAREMIPAPATNKRPA